MEYQITLNEAQLKAIELALEEYFRLRLGQTSDLAEDLAFSGFNYKDHTEAEFNDRLRRRDGCQDLLNEAIRAARGSELVHLQGMDKTSMICEDIWQVIRHQLWQDNPAKKEWTVDSSKPFARSGEPLPTIEKNTRKET